MNNKMKNLLKIEKKQKKMKNESFKSFWERNRMSNNYLLRKKIGTGFFKFARAIMLFGLCFLILQPLLNKISVSLMMEKDLYDATVINIPRNLTTDNYSLVSSLMNFPRSLLSTLWVSLVIAVIQVASTTLVGYGFARYKFPGKNLLFGAVILSIVIPPQTLLTAIYLNFRYFDFFGIIKALGGKPLNLLNSIWPYVLMSASAMGLKNGLYIY
ncbi:MAG TPA: carbohydrate ABC transporter permease, partial [Mobilitalea sp.]|nr:carbohydrate ABC transporter permease [Mobilitalea sp.]